MTARQFWLAISLGWLIGVVIMEVWQEPILLLSAVPMGLLALGYRWRRDR